MSLTLMEARVMERLRTLPRDRVEEVLDFIDFLTARESTRFLAGRLAESLASLDVMDLPMLDADALAECETTPPPRPSRGMRGSAFHARR